MSSRSAQRITFAKHVYLRTQQRRLRHVKSVVVRNLLSLLDYNPDPLDIEVYFTVHPIYNSGQTLFKSEVISRTCNPSWESVQFSTPVFGKQSSLSMFTIKVWVRPFRSGDRPSPLDSPMTPSKPSICEAGTEKGARPEGEAKLAFEKSIDLADLVYLGTLVNKDGSCYPINSLVIGMFEGYYSDPGVGGVPATPPIIHSLVDLLPPCSLLEVTRTEVQESYLSNALQRMLYKQEVLNNTTMEGNRSKVKVQQYMREQGDYFRKRRERENMRMRTALLQRQIQQQERLEKEESERLTKLKEMLNSFEVDLREQQVDLQRKKDQHQQSLLTHFQHVESLASKRKNCTLRQRNMVYDLSQTFFIKEVKETKDTFTICNVILPNSDQLEQISSQEQFGVALGFVAHLISHLSKVLLVPLQYPIKTNSSRSTISDHVSDEVIIDTIKEFPLFLKGSEKALFLYAVHLLNKDVSQIRQHCGYGGSRSMQKKTLPNLKFLLDELIKDFFLMTKSVQHHAPPSSPNWTPSSQPINTTLSKSTVENSHFRHHMSTNSSQSSYATTATVGLSLTPPTPSTMGLSLTPPTPGLSLTPPTPSTGMALGLSMTPPNSTPGLAMDHETFHSIRQPVAEGGGGVASEVLGEVSGTGRDSIQDDSPDGFDVEIFRSRSSHVTAGYPPKGSGSVGGSSHEQLHVGAVSMEQDSPQLRRGQGGAQVPSLEKSNSPSLAPPTFPNTRLSESPEEERELQQQQQQQQHSNREHSVRQHGNRKHCDRQHSDEEHSMVHYGRNQDDIREASPAGTGLFSPPEECASLPSVGVAGSSPGVTLMLGSDRGGGKGVESHTEGVELDGELTSSRHASNHNHMNGATSVGGVGFSRGDIDEVEGESSLDFRSVRRSSKLVDPNDLQALRVRAGSREHNLPPSVPATTPLPPDSKQQQQQVQQQQVQQQQQQLQESLTESYTGSIHFTASGFSTMSPSSDNGIMSSTPTGNYMKDSGGGRCHVPQVFVEQPFSPPDVTRPTTDPAAPDFPNISDWSSRGGIDHSHSTDSRSLAEEELSSVGLGPSPHSLGLSGADESDSSVSPPLPPKLKEGKVKEVELAEISTLPDAKHLTGQPSLSSGKMNASTNNNPFSASAVNSTSTAAGNAYSTAMVNPHPTTTSSPPMSNASPPSPVLLPRVDSHPRATYSSSFSTFLHSPMPYKSSLATPHVLGGRGHDDDTEPPEQTRVRANSNRTERWSSHDPRLKVGVSPSPSSTLSHSTEGSTDFLENFIDGF